MERIITKTAKSDPLLPRGPSVAAYARVSSGKDAMLQSLAAQVSYYSELIQRRPDWEYAGVYADEALTGTKENRPEFRRMLADCRDGKVDMIITKSISRFARNTVTLLETVRELKSLGVDVYFEEQNIHSISGDGELMLTILASYAQAESLSASENCKWRVRKRFENGELAGLNFMFGYLIAKGEIEIDPEQAAVVRMIFDDYIGGMGGGRIAKKLMGMNVATVRGADWNSERVMEILRNEKYTGNALLQKKYVADHLTKKLVRNTGALPQYFAEGTHPAIIDTATFEKAQAVMEERRRRYDAKDTSDNRYPFSGIIRCGNCDKNYKRRVAAGRVAWQCSTFLKNGKAACHAKQIPEPVLYITGAEVLGQKEFDAEIFKKEIAEIRVPEFNKLVFVFRDGHTAEKAWQDRSRRESWTDEMRQAASQRAKGGR
ncbi:MAG: recombinase family protein [Dethiobacter sp.]|nr:recombinase family protein [Dethiobacter sp.]MBS3899672.1 recombinase family protein [Dethiobacter sp.]